MDIFTSTSRLPSISLEVILAQTDTTVGFLSQNKTRLNEIKSRPQSKQFITIYDSFKTLVKEKRVPQSKKNFIRRSKKTTFIVKNKAFRVVKSKLDSAYIKQYSWGYSTSANKSNEDFDRSFCEDKADIIIEDKESLFQGKASKLYKINNFKVKRLR